MDDAAPWRDDLRSSDPARRALGAEQAARLGSAAQAAAVDLVRAAADESPQVRDWAVAALEELGPPPAADRKALQELLMHAGADAGFWAATLLGRLGDGAAEATPALVAALQNSPHPAVQQRAAWALAQIGPAAAAAALPALRHAAQSADPRLARWAQQALTRLEKETS